MAIKLKQAPQWLTVEIDAGTFEILAREPSTKAAIGWMESARDTSDPGALFRQAAKVNAGHVRAFRGVEDMDADDYPDTEQDRLEFWLGLPALVITAVTNVVMNGDASGKSNEPGS